MRNSAVPRPPIIESLAVEIRYPRREDDLALL